MTTQITKQENGNQNRAWASALLDVFESKDEYLVFADVPGVKDDGIQIELKDGQLRVEAKRELSGDDRWSTDFRRVLSIGPDVDIEKITASIKDGVLEIHLPKSASVKPKQIAVKTAR